MKYRLTLPLAALLLCSLHPAHAAGKDSRKGTARQTSGGQTSGGLALPALPPPTLVPPKPVTTGAFRDADGKDHVWRITAAHALEWDGGLYLPAGGAFTPRSWQDGGQTEDAWAKDKAALDALKAHGVRDLYLYAGPDGLTRVPPAAVQKVFDYLDAGDFRYGLEIADFPKDPLVGYVVKPSVYRDPAPPLDGTPAQFAHIPGLVDAFYLLATRDGQTEESGTAQTVGDTARVTLKTPSSGDVLLLYPQRLFFGGTPESHLPDLWQGYDEYRDRLLTYFSHVKFGKGFRFFLDPLTEKIGFYGEVENLVPTTDGFHLDFEAWLNHKYNHNVDDLNKGWGIKERDLPDFATAAHCLPLWFQTRGLQALYDPAKKIQYAVLGTNLGKGFWDDLRQFRVDSTRGYMNAIADVLKKSVADVPVVYKWTQFSPLFTNPPSAGAAATGGFDGLGMEAYGHGQALLTQSAAYTDAQVEDAPKTMWLIASGTGASEAPGAAGKAAPGYVSKNGLFSDWNALLDGGARGFFTQALQRLPADKYADANLAALPDQLDWLGAYAATLTAGASSLESGARRVLWYPYNAAGLDIGVRTLPGDVWWLPSFRPGYALDLGPDLRAYTLASADGSVPSNVLWSPTGKLTQIKIPFPKGTQPVITDPLGIPVQAGSKNDVWSIPVSAVPILIRRVPSIPLPQDVVESAGKEAKRLLDLADQQHVATDLFKSRYFYATNTIPDKDEATDARYLLYRGLIRDLTQALSPYAWIEAENPAAHTFSAIVPQPDASGGAYLTLDSDRVPPRPTADSDGGYRAQYKFALNAPGQYALWMAGSAPSGDASSFTYTVDGGGANTPGESGDNAAPYANGFVWTHLGDATLARGVHTLTVTVTGPRPSDGHYALSLDAFCVSRVPFHPEGTRRPAIDVLPPPNAPAPPSKDDKDKDFRPTPE